MNTYKVPLELYIEAYNKETAEGLAQMYAFVATTALRQANSGWVQDRKSKVVAPGLEAEVIGEIPSIDYDKEKLIKVFGEDRAISILNYMLSKMQE